MSTPPITDEMIFRQWVVQAVGYIKELKEMQAMPTEPFDTEVDAFLQRIDEAIMCGQLPLPDGNEIVCVGVCSLCHCGMPIVRVYRFTPANRDAWVAELRNPTDTRGHSGRKRRRKSKDEITRDEILAADVESSHSRLFCADCWCPK